MKRTFILYLAAFVFFITPNNFTQIPTDNPLKSKIDRVVQTSVKSFMKSGSRVGLSLGIYNQDKIYTYNYGSTQKKKQILPTNNTIYEIGSISKTITGLLLAQAVIDKKVNLDDDVRKYLSGSYPNLEYDGHPIKLFQLLNHTSGLPFNIWQTQAITENTNKDSLPYILSLNEKKYTKKQFLEDLHNVKIDTIPGIKLSYSNSASSASWIRFRKC